MDNIRIFHVQRQANSSTERIVEFSTESQYLTCNCKHYTFTGIICRHVFRVATQLNLDEMPRFLYLTRWCKDPDDTILAQRFREFYNTSNNIILIKESHITTEEDYQYLLKRTLDNLQRFIKAKPENAKYFYEIISAQLDEKMSLNNSQNKDSVTSSNLFYENVIRNPRNIKPKGRPPKNRILSALEISNKPSKRVFNNKQTTKVIGIYVTAVYWRIYI